MWGISGFDHTDEANYTVILTPRLCSISPNPKTDSVL